MGGNLFWTTWYSLPRLERCWIRATCINVCSSPAIENAGLRKVRIHDLRHTFASLLIQDGANLAYVKEQLGHSSIAVTVDLYGHLAPSVNIAFVDRLDATTIHN